jgi:hypothetical protein
MCRPLHKYDHLMLSRMRDGFVPSWNLSRFEATDDMQYITSPAQASERNDSPVSLEDLDTADVPGREMRRQLSASCFLRKTKRKCCIWQAVLRAYG